MLTNYLGWHGQPNDLQGIFWFGHFPTSEVFRFPSKALPPEMPNPQALHTPMEIGMFSSQRHRWTNPASVYPQYKGRVQSICRDNRTMADQERQEKPSAVISILRVQPGLGQGYPKPVLFWEFSLVLLH